MTFTKNIVIKLLWIMVAISLPAFAQTEYPILNEQYHRLPNDVELNSSYCLAVMQHQYSEFSSFLISIQTSAATNTNSQQQEAQKLLEEQIPNLKKNIQQLSDGINHIQLFILPRMQYLDPTSILYAYSRGEEDFNKQKSEEGRRQSNQCQNRCTNIGDEGIKINGQCLKNCMEESEFNRRIFQCRSFWATPPATVEEQTPLASPEQQHGNEDNSRDLVRINNSSVWISRYEYDQFITGKQLPAYATLRGPISKEDVLVFKILLTPYIDKNYLKKHPKPIWYKEQPYENGYLVVLDSNGGDVNSAMEIGRLFRKARVLASVDHSDKCLSSCVLLLAGAVSRNVLQGTVGIHRPYSLDTTPASYEKLQSRTENLGRAVSDYLKKMNVPESLYEAMKLIPPEEVKILSDTELDKFGLSQDDPVFSELLDNAQSNLAGVSKIEFLSRKELAKKCLENGYSQLKKNSNGDADMLEFMKLQYECDSKLIYKGALNKSKKQGVKRGKLADRTKKPHI